MKERAAASSYHTMHLLATWPSHAPPPGGGGCCIDETTLYQRRRLTSFPCSVWCAGRGKSARASPCTALSRMVGGRLDWSSRMFASEQLLLSRERPTRDASRAMGPSAPEGARAARATEMPPSASSGSSICGAAFEAVGGDGSVVCTHYSTTQRTCYSTTQRTAAALHARSRSATRAALRAHLRHELVQRWRPRRLQLSLCLVGRVLGRLEDVGVPMAPRAHRPRAGRTVGAAATPAPRSRFGTTLPLNPAKVLRGRPMVAHCRRIVPGPWPPCAVDGRHSVVAERRTRLVHCRRVFTSAPLLPLLPLLEALLVRAQPREQRRCVTNFAS